MAAPFVATEAQRKQVRAMAAYGIPHEEIAKVVGCTRPTLRKYFRDELDTASAQANARVAEMLYQQAMKGNVTAQIFWLKTRARWREVDREEQPKEQRVRVIVRGADDDADG